MNATMNPYWRPWFTEMALKDKRFVERQFEANQQSRAIDYGPPSDAVIALMQRTQNYFRRQQIGPRFDRRGLPIYRVKAGSAPA